LGRRPPRVRDRALQQAVHRGAGAAPNAGQL